MKYEFYNPVDEKGNCIIRSFSKLLDKAYFVVKEELLELTSELNYEDYREIEVFEEYLKRNKYVISKNSYSGLIKDLILPKGRYVIFCNKDDFYHMVTVVDNVLYDKNDKSFDLDIIKIYEKKD